MTVQLLHYQQPERHQARFLAPIWSDRVSVAHLLTGFAIIGASTAAADVRPVGLGYALRTNATPKIAARESEIRPVDALDEIKELSGLTWSQLAGLLGVARKTLHDWSAGATLRGANEGKLYGLLDQVRSMAELPKYKIRNALLATKASAKLGAVDGPLVVSDNTPARHRQTKLVGSLVLG